MTTIYSDRYLPKKGELSNNLRNFDRERVLLFDEKQVFDEIIDDLQDYARVSLRENYDLNTEVRQFIYSVYEGGNRNA